MSIPLIINNPIDESVLAIIIKGDYEHDGISFFTPDDYSQQLAYMKHPKGHTIIPHIHNQVHRSVFFTQEVLVIKSGKIRVNFFDKNKAYLESFLLSQGDTILLASGGHGFDVLEDCEMYEIKQGPYLGEQDKERFAVDIKEYKYHSEDA